MIGIYRIFNKITGKSYIGQSKNIQKRIKDHWRIYKNSNSLEYNNQIHTGMREEGINNFDYEIIEECKESELNEKEKFYIAKFNSYRNGYNATEGGDFSNVDNRGERNGRSLLTEEDVRAIRKLYNNRIPFRDTYKNFAQKISMRGFRHIWLFETWQYIHPEYNTLENKKWHSTKAKSLSSEVAKNNKPKLTKIEVIDIKNRFINGESVASIWKNSYSHLSKSTIYRVAHNLSYKNILL